MLQSSFSRRNFLASCGGGIATLAAASQQGHGAQPEETPPSAYHQRLSLEKLKAWEALGYGMFLHFGMSTYVQQELPDGKTPATTYAPDRLDVDQWISVARDAGMKYAVLCAKHVAGHCLWPTRFTEYSVTNSSDKTDVVGKFVESCQKRGILPGLYYCSWDNHNRFGSQTPSDQGKDLPAYTTSLYQTFQTNQVTELLTQYGPIHEVWIDIPGVLGRGYRTFLYNTIAQLQPDTVIMMNSGISTQENYNIDYAWPSDIIAIERSLPPEQGHQKVRNIEGKDYYIPGEVCDPIGKEWFYVDGDRPRDDSVLTGIYLKTREHGANLLLDVPPDRSGLIPDESIQALQRLKRNAEI